LDAEEGVQSQSETVWRQADKYKVPRLCFVNKMDKLGADFLATVKSIEDRLGANPAIMVLPIGAEASYKGIYDLLHRKSLVWSGEELVQNIQFQMIFLREWDRKLKNIEQN